MDDATHVTRLVRTLRHSYRLFARGAPDNSTIELDGVTASVCPGAPDRSVLNAVVYEDAAALERAVPELAAAYESAGIRAWTVWVPPGDRRTPEVLAEAGHVLDATPEAMAIELAALGPPPGPEPTWEGDWSGLADAALVNDRAYGDPDGLWDRSLGGLPEGTGHLYLHRAPDGEPLSMVLVHDVGDDCCFWFAATVPAGRGRGLVSGMLHRALRDARDRGCITSTTEATKMGTPVYARIGYRGLGALEMWERRTPAPV